MPHRFSAAWVGVAGVLCFAAGVARAAAADAAIAEVKVISQQPEYYDGWPTVAALRNGLLVTVFSGGREWHICPFGRVEEMVSRDGGTTWSFPRILLDSATDDRDSGICETARGTLLVNTFTSLAYREQMAAPARVLEPQFKGDLAAHLARWRTADIRLTDAERKADVGLWFVRSADGGRTWSERLPAPCQSPHGPTQLADGRLLFAGKALWTTERVGVWDSADDGRTWRHLADFPARPGETILKYHEPYAIQAADGTIIAHLRNQNTKARNTLQTESRDGGKTWTVPHDIGVSGYPSHLLRLKDDALLMTYGVRTAPFGIRGKVSRDNGRSWSNEFFLTRDGPGYDLGYPSTAQLADGRLVTIWYEVMTGSPKAVLRQATWRLE